MPHPDEQISENYRHLMNALAGAIDKLFNPEDERKVCFVLLCCEFDKEGRCNYISNGERSNVVNLLKEMVARFEGQAELKGTA